MTPGEFVPRHGIMCTHLHDGVDRTRLLTEAAVDAFGHVDVVASRPPAAVGASLRLDGDGLDRDGVGGEAGHRHRAILVLSGLFSYSQTKPTCLDLIHK